MIQKSHLSMVTVCSLLLLGGFIGQQETRDTSSSSSPNSESGWRVVFANDENGNTLAGDKQALIDAVRVGKPVRVLFGGGRVEHIVDAGFLTIFQGEVFAQTRSIEAQQPVGKDENSADPKVESENGVPSIIFRAPGTHWRVILGSNGTSSALMDGSSPNERRRAVRWFVND